MGGMRVIGLDPFSTPLLSITWYLRSLFLLVLISLFLVFALKKNCVVTIIMCYLIYVLSYGYSNWGMPLSMCFVRRCFSTQGLAFFIIGMAIRLVGDFNPLNNRYKAWGAIIIGAVLFVIKGYFLYLSQIRYSQFMSTVAIPFLLFGVWYFVPSRAWPKSIVGSSFAIYLIHMFVVYPFQKMGGSTFLQTWYGFLIGYCAVVLISVFSALLIKKCCPIGAKILFGGR